MGRWRWFQKRKGDARGDSGGETELGMDLVVGGI